MTHTTAAASLGSVFVNRIKSFRAGASRGQASYTAGTTLPERFESSIAARLNTALPASLVGTPSRTPTADLNSWRSVLCTGGVAGNSYRHLAMIQMD